MSRWFDCFRIASPNADIHFRDAPPDDLAKPLGLRIAAPFSLQGTSMYSRDHRKKICGRPVAATELWLPNRRILLRGVVERMSVPIVLLKAHRGRKD